MSTPITNPVLRRIADADPARTPGTASTEPAPVVVLTPAEHARAEALLARLEATPRGTAAAALAAERRKVAPATAPSTSATARPATRSKLKARLAATCATAVAVVGALLLGPTTASAEGVLLQAADAAALQPAEEGSYWYAHWQTRNGAPGGHEDPSLPFDSEREIWLGREGGVLRDGAWAADPADIRVETLDYGGPTLFGDGADFTWDEVIALPTDAAALRALILERTVETGHGDSWELYDNLSALLVESPAPPLVRRAMWTVMAGIPEMSNLGPTTDGLGRPGTLIEVDFSRQRLGVYQYVLDPTDGTVLETRSLGPDNETVAFRQTLVEHGMRDSAPPADPPRCGPGSVPETSC